VNDFPNSDLILIKLWAIGKIAYYKGRAAGTVYWLINGVKQPITEADIARANAELVIWEEVITRTKIGVIHGNSM
jgi:hypothetical protein